jgi:hypothetical protein
MRPEIQRAALRAAARLALSATVFGCASSEGGRAGTGSSSAADETDTTTSPAAPTGARFGTTDAGLPNTGVCGGSETCDDERVDCCAEVVSCNAPDAGDTTWPPVAAAPVVECCGVLERWHDANWDAGGFEWPNRDFCCAVTGWEGSRTCTPWGPPVPPAMKGGKRVRRALGVA